MCHNASNAHHGSRGVDNTVLQDDKRMALLCGTTM